MEHKKIHPGYYTTTYKEGPEGKGKKDSFVTEEHREEIKTENEMFEPAGFKQEKDLKMSKHDEALEQKEDLEAIGKKIEVLEHKEMFKPREDSEMIKKKTEVL